MRHIEVRDLWLKEEVAKGLVRVVKVPGEANPVDLMTKFLQTAEIGGHLKRLGLVERRKDAKTGGGRTGPSWADLLEEGQGAQQAVREIDCGGVSGYSRHTHTCTDMRCFY